MRPTIISALMAILLTGCTDTPSAEPNPPVTTSSVVEEAVTLMRWTDLTDRPLPQPTSTHPYGDDPAQTVDLWRPDGPGPHPVVLMIHGGCWQKAIADRTLMNYAAEDLRQRGMAVWNIEYRGVDEAGGAYPGIFEDVRRAAERLIDTGPELGLDVSQIVAIGHSAGGHLAAWLATQTNLPDTSPLYPGRYFPLKAVIISGGLADLEASTPVTLESCLAQILDNLTGSPGPERAHVLSDTSPAELLPTDTILVSVNGDRDRIAPPSLGRAFTEVVKASGGEARYVEIENTGHVELVSPGTAAFDAQAELINDYLSKD